MQSHKRPPSQLDDFDQEVIIGNTANGRQQTVVDNESTVEQEFTVNDNGSSLAANEILVHVKTLEICFKERKWVKLLTLSSVGSKTQFSLQLIVKLLPELHWQLVQKMHPLDGYDQCYSEFRAWAAYRGQCLF